MKKIEDLEKKIEYTFQNKEYLYVALTHSSYANEMKINKCDNYERQEFLGDAVLELVSSDYLFREHPNMPEGNLTKTRASLVCEPALAHQAREIGLEEYIRLGRGEEATGGRGRDSIISDVLEAVIGGIYLDGGIEPAKTFVNKFVMDGAEEKILFYDAKSILQQRVQAKGKNLEYVLVEEKGPDHMKTFVMEAYINGEKVSTGQGNTKKSAEQQAAFAALRSNICI